ncbi:Two component regulator three Y domain protein [Flavobacterium sp.]|uniref:leucine-rich repeat domain-containing protein n=1 Tax=Flavobacterium sp. TaxID=239 RepID=UPI00262D93AF|nr:Two component regulator three Y domain protein [Flavobacterium sp.]
MKSIFTFLVITFLSTTAFAEVSVSEKNALIELNKSTNGSQWNIKWDLNSSVSTWYGVKVVNDKVVAIDLSSNNLSGTLPVVISDLVNLKSLILFQNSIIGELPKSIGNMKSLEVLNVSFNKLSGSLFAEVCNATSLKTVELFMNNLSGSIPSEIKNLKKLEVLSLYNNQITGEIPSELFEVKSLKVLQLNSNKITGSLSNDIANLIALENLSLFDNNMNGQVPFDLEKLNNLKEMNISYNNFNGFVSRKLSQKDVLNMTMVNEYGVASALKIEMDKDKAIVSEE